MALPFGEVPLLAGVLLAWSLAAPPGPANALIAHNAARRGWLSGLTTGLGAVTGDAVMFSLMALGVVAGVFSVAWVQVALGVVGAALLAWFAWEAYGSARNPHALDVRASGGFARSFVTVVTSPFNWAWWATLGGSLFAQLGMGVVVGFFGGLLLWIVFWSGLSRAGAARLARFTEVVAYGAALVLAVFAILVGAFTVGVLRGLLY